MHIIVGLGNPGQKYRNTRHNVGFRVINLWAKSLDVSFGGKRFSSRNVRARYQENEILLLRPQTYMNESGKSVRACVDFYKLAPEKLLVIHDDLDLEVGRVKVVKSGGAGGHKGVSSLIQHLGTRDFPRVKIGIGRPRYTEPIEEYVLRPFYKDERTVVEKVTRLGVQACELTITSGIESTMNVINCQDMTSREVLT